MVGYLFILSGVIFPLILNSIVTATEGESFSRDLFGLPIPHPPTWVSLIPFLGWLLGIIFELFSLHGLVIAGISGALVGVGVLLVSCAEGNQSN